MLVISQGEQALLSLHHGKLRLASQSEEGLAISLSIYVLFYYIPTMDQASSWVLGVQ